MGEFLEFREVSKSFGSITAVDNVSLEVKRGLIQLIKSTCGFYNDISRVLTPRYFGWVTLG